MGRVIIRQPNGKCMLWSSIIEQPIMVNMTEENYINFKMKEAKEEAIETFRKYKKDPDYVFDVLFCYNMDDKEKNKLYGTLLSVGYKKEDIKDLFFVNDNLEEGVL